MTSVSLSIHSFCPFFFNLRNYQNNMQIWMRKWERKHIELRLTELELKRKLYRQKTRYFFIISQPFIIIISFSNVSLSKVFISELHSSSLFFKLITAHWYSLPLSLTNTLPSSSEHHFPTFITISHHPSAFIIINHHLIHSTLRSIVTLFIVEQILNR